MRVWLRVLPALVFENPLIRRQLATSLTPTKLSFAFGLVVVTLAVADLGACLFNVFEPGFDLPAVAGGRALQLLNLVVLFFLLTLLLPLRLAGYIEGPRIGGSFEQLVVTGVSPLTLQFGNWLLTWLYALAILFVSLPFCAFAWGLGALTFGEVVAGYAVLAAYSHVVIAVALAAGTFEREWLTTPLVMGGIAIAAACSAAPMWPAALAEAVPLRALFRAGLDATEYAELVQSRWGGPSFLSHTVSAASYAACLWSGVVLLCVARLLTGPDHRFRAGLNNFGDAVFRGDRKRRWLPRLRLSLTRRIELRFLYENRPAWLDSWDAMLRLASYVVLVVLAWWVSLSMILPFGFSLYDSRMLRNGELLAILGVGFVIVFVAICFRPLTRESVEWPNRFFRFELSRGILATICFAVSLCLYVGIGAYAFEKTAESAGMRLAEESAPVTEAGDIAPSIPGDRRPSSRRWHELTEDSLHELRDHWYVALASAAITLSNCFLFGLLLARWLRGARAWVAGMIFGLLLTGFGPLLVVVLREMGAVSHRLLPVFFASPLSVLLTTDPNFREDVLESYGWAAESGFRAFFAINVTFAALVVLLLGILRWRRRRHRATTGPSGIVAAVSVVAGALLHVFSGTPLVAQERADVEIVELRRAFEGRRCRGAADYMTLVVRNNGVDAVRGRLRIVRSPGYDEPEILEVEIPGQTTKTVRWLSERRRGFYGGGEPHLVIEERGKVLARRALPGLTIVAVESTRNSSRTTGDDEREGPVFAVVSGRGEFPRFDDSSVFRWVRSRSRDLPEDHRAYYGLGGVLLHETDVRTLTPGQRRALLDYVRLGGVLVLSGRIEAQWFDGLPIWEKLLDAGALQSREVSRDGVRVYVADGFSARPRLWWEPSARGAAVPLVSVKSVGPGFIAHLGLDPFVTEKPWGAQKFYAELAATLPGACYPFTVTADIPRDRDRLNDYRSMVFVSIYLVVYAIALPLGLLLFFRKRRLRFALLYTAVLGALFASASPWVRSVLFQRPSYAEIHRTLVYGSEDLGGVAQANLRVRSSGRQRHRTEVSGEELGALLSLPPSLPGDVPSISTGEGVDRIVTDDLPPLTPWSTGSLLYFGQVQRPEPMRGRLLFNSDSRQIQFQLLGMPSEEVAPSGYLFLLLVDFPGLKTFDLYVFRQRYVSRVGDLLSGEVSCYHSRGDRRRVHAPWGGFELNVGRHGHPRAFVGMLLTEAPPGLHIGSPDLRFEREVTLQAGQRVSYDFNNTLRYSVRGDQVFQRLDATLLLQEIEVEIR